MIQLIKGFKDILPAESGLWRHIENTSRELFENFGFREIRLPIVEKSELFARSIGDTTDIVEKEMYTFDDGRRGSVTLRPEATASVVRSYIQHKMYAREPIQKFYTIGPMFRRERPQKGRYRQFYQIDAEVFGIASPYIDAQMIFMLVSLFEKLEADDVKAHLNSLGCPECRPKYQAALLELLEKNKESLCENCVRRSDKNPLRVLDCKAPGCKEATREAPAILDYLCEDCNDHFEVVTSWLTKMGVEYTIDKNLVRGLDYYTRTTFEILTGSLGAQNAVAGGGRYDGLVEALGGQSQPAIGFAIGFDRLAEILASKGDPCVKNPDLFIAAVGDTAREKGFEWAAELSRLGIATEMEFAPKSLKAQMKKADKLCASRVLIVGDEELESGFAKLRNMKTKEQNDINIGKVVESLTELLIVLK